MGWKHGIAGDKTILMSPRAFQASTFNVPVGSGAE